jgi:ADP-glucose pyrophosphorylase
METPRPMDAGTLRPGLGCVVREGSAVDGDVASSRDETRVVCRVEEGIRDSVVLDDTEVLSSFPVSVAAVVSCTTVKDGVGVGDGASEDVGTALSVVDSATSDG